MKAKRFIGIALGLMIIMLMISPDLMAQCSICSKVTADLGTGAAKGLNAGILYLIIVPFSVVGFIGYRWYKGNVLQEEEETD